MSDAATFEPSGAVSLQALEHDAQTAKFIITCAMTVRHPFDLCMSYTSNYDANAVSDLGLDVISSRGIPNGEEMRDQHCCRCLLSGSVSDKLLRINSHSDVISRVSMIANFVLIIIFQSSLLGCTSLFIVMIATMTGIGAAADSYLFFLRVRAVCNNSRTVTLGFGAGCLVVAATNIALPFSLHASVRARHSTSIEGLLLTSSACITASWGC